VLFATHISAKLGALGLGSPKTLLSERKHVSGHHSRTILKRYFNDLIDQIVRGRQFIDYSAEQLALPCRKDLRHDYDKAGVQFFLRVELPKIPCVIGHKREIALNDARHKIPVSFAAQSQPVHMGTLVAKILRDGHE